MTELLYPLSQTNRLRDAVERLDIPSVAAALGFGELAAGRRNRSPFYADSRPDFAISQDGKTFCDHGNSGEHRGGLVEFVALARKCSRRESADYLVELANIPKTNSALVGNGKVGAVMSFAAAPSSKGKRSVGQATEKPAPNDILEAWLEGCTHLAGDQMMIESICRWRRWRPAWVLALARAELMGCPRARHGMRLVAFSVQFRAGSIIGYHQRQKPETPSARASWRFVPAGVPSLPFTLGDVTTADGIVITEGQWDAATLAGSAGWLDEGKVDIPKGVAVVGLRGAGSWRQFVERFTLSRKARVLLIPDNDDAGLCWTAGANSFAAGLREKVRKVSVVHALGGKDINEAHINEALTRETVIELLEKNGILPRRRTSSASPPAESNTMSRFSGGTLMELHKIGPLEPAERESIGWAIEVFQGTVELEGTR